MMECKSFSSMVFIFIFYFFLIYFFKGNVTGTWNSVELISSSTDCVLYEAQVDYGISQAVATLASFDLCHSSKLFIFFFFQ